VTVKKTMKVTDSGRLLCIFVNEASVKKREVVEPRLDLLGITKSIASIKAWLDTSPTLMDVDTVREYELAHRKRSGVIGTMGCLTLHLEGV